MLGGVLISNVAFVLAACCLYALGVEVLRDRRLARRGALLFCCTPASVFFSSLYTESPFASTTPSLTPTLTPTLTLTLTPTLTPTLTLTLTPTLT